MTKSRIRFSKISSWTTNSNRKIVGILCVDYHELCVDGALDSVEGAKAGDGARDAIFPDEDPFFPTAN